jgi:hypothetical protein
VREYEEQRVVIRRTGRNRYLTIAHGPTAAAAPFELERPKHIVDEFDELLRTDRGGAYTVAGSQRLDELARKLAATIMPPPVRDSIQRSYDLARAVNHGLRLRFDVTPELGNLPFEILPGLKNQPLGLARDETFSVVRSVPGSPDATRLPAPNDPAENLTVLAVVSTPDGVPPLDVDRELDAVGKLVKHPATVHTAGWPRGGGSGPLTQQALEQALDSCNGEPLVVLLIAHGDENGAVILESDRGDPVPASSEALAGLLSPPQRRVRVVILNLCWSGRLVVPETFASLAMTIVAAGIPAVVAMRSTVSDAAAAAASPALLQALTRNLTIDEAVTRARIAMHDNAARTKSEWSIPALFLHQQCRHGWLLKSRRVGPGAADPLRDGARDLRDCQGGKGDIPQEVALRAARFSRWQSDWPEVARIAEALEGNAESAEIGRRLHAEAQVHLLTGELETVVEILGQDQHDRIDEAKAIVKKLWGVLDDELVAPLDSEVSETATLIGLYAQAAASAKARAWDGVVASCREILQLRPRGFADASDLLACAELRIEIERLEGEEDWSAAAELYAELEPLAGAAVAAEWAYARGRIAESTGRWAEAAVAYAESGAGDASHRASYMRGLAAVEDERWEDAVAAFSEVAEGHLPEIDRQLGDRLRYARGRVAENRQEWEQAAACFAELDGADAVARRRFATGRAAESNDDWQGVIDGFADLADADHDGLVGVVRSYARARLAEDEGEWPTVATELRDKPPAYADGHLGRLRRYAEGRLAEANERWEDVERAFHDLGDAYPDAAARVAYARGRLFEVDSRWDEAAAAYGEAADHGDSVAGGVTDAYRDASTRESYARARFSEERGDWATAQAHLEPLHEDFEDRGSRLAYVHARREAAVEHWDQARTAVRALDDSYRDVAALRAYWDARAAQDVGDWDTAAARYADCTRYPEAPPDAPQRRAYAEGWLHEAAGRWTAAARSYSDAGDSGDTAAQLDRVRRLLQLVPWADGLTDAKLVADPLAGAAGADVYAHLRAAGISPSSSADEVKAASFALMERGAMTPAARVAWDRLRTRRERLKVDAFLHRLVAAEPLRSVLATLDPRTVVPLDTLCESAPEDEPLLLLLGGRREVALAAWELRVRDRPNASAAAHGLAITRFWQACQHEDSGAHEQAPPAWETAIATWAFVLNDDDYWATWREERSECYREPVSQADLARLRREIGEQILGTLTDYSDRYAREGRTQRARTYHRLALSFELELEAAQLLKGVGRLPINGGEERFACGPLYLRKAGFERQLGRLVASLDADMSAGSEDLITSLDAALGVGGAGERPQALAAETISRLRRVFSTLGEAHFLLECAQHEAALAALPPAYQSRLADLPADCAPDARQANPEHADRCAYCSSFAERGDWAYLYLPHRHARLLLDAVEIATRANLALAQAALVRGTDALDEAREWWRQAVEASRRAGSQVRTKRAIARVVLGRASALFNETGARRAERLTEAIALIEAALSIVGGVDEGQLVGKQAEMLTARGIWHGTCYEFAEPDFEQALVDLRRALELNPESQYCRENLVHALIQAAMVVGSGDTQNKLPLLADAIAILHDGIQRSGSHHEFRDLLATSFGELEEWASHELSSAEIVRLVVQMGEGDDDADGATRRAASLGEQAERKLESGDLIGGMRLLLAAAREEPGDAGLRRRLIDVVRELSGADRDGSPT